MKALLKNSGLRPVRLVGRNGCFDDTASGTGILPAILGCAGIWPHGFPRLGRRVAALPHDNVTRGGQMPLTQRRRCSVLLKRDDLPA